MATPQQVIVVSEEDYLSLKQVRLPGSKSNLGSVAGKDPEEKVVDPNLVPLSVPRLSAHPSLARGIRANKPVKAWLSYYQGTSGAANTAFAFGWTLQPNQDSSWTSWQATFDEVRVVHAELMWNVFFTALPTANPTNAPNAIVVYDPTTTVTLASVNAGLQFERFDLMRIQLPSPTPFLVSPQNVSKGGFQRFSTKIPTGTTLSTTVTTNSTGCWRNTADAVGYEWGNFAGYCAQGGATSVIRAEGFVRMLCEFRVRR